MGAGLSSYDLNESWTTIPIARIEDLSDAVYDCLPRGDATVGGSASGSLAFGQAKKRPAAATKIEPGSRADRNEVKYYSGKTGASKDKVEFAVKSVGNSRKEVEERLGTK
jgi:hypothetical protein